MARRWPLESRFNKYVDKTTPHPLGCWMWIGGKTPQDYGWFWLDGRAVGAHRVAILISRGRLPDTGYVCHTCDNPSCVRPEHLVVADSLWNNRDRARKGRNGDLRGERHGCAKLTNGQVLAIRADDRSQRAIARCYGITPKQVKNIRTRKMWRHI